MHPYRDIERPETGPVEQLSVESCQRIARAAVRSWSLLRVLVAVAQHRLPLEGAIAAALLVLLANSKITMVPQVTLRARPVDTLKGPSRGQGATMRRLTSFACALAVLGGCAANVPPTQEPGTAAVAQAPDAATPTTPPAPKNR